MKLRLQRTAEYFRIKMGRFNIYFADHTLRVRNGGLERSSLRRKRFLFKEQVLESRKVCEMCGQALEWDSASVHHIEPVCVNPDRRFDPTNVMLLCRGCHYDIHQAERLAKALAMKNR